MARTTHVLRLDVDAIRARAREGRAFGNGTEGEIWSSRWCETCTHDDDDLAVYCPVLGVALIEPVTPAEWTGDPYECSEYEPASPRFDARA
jgi:hypothetical protein